MQYVLTHFINSRDRIRTKVTFVCQIDNHCICIICLKMSNCIFPFKIAFFRHITLCTIGHPLKNFWRSTHSTVEDSGKNLLLHVFYPKTYIPTFYHYNLKFFRFLIKIYAFHNILKIKSQKWKLRLLKNVFFSLLFIESTIFVLFWNPVAYFLPTASSFQMTPLKWILNTSWANISKKRRGTQIVLN